MIAIDCDEHEFRRIAADVDFICYGGRQMAIEAIQTLGIGQRVRFIVDTNPVLWGRYLKVGDRSYQIVPPKKLETIDGSSYRILITSEYTKEIMESLNSMENLAVTKCYVYLDIKINIQIGTEDFFQKRILSRCLELFREEIDLQEKDSEQKEIMEKAYYSYLTSVNTAGDHPFVVPQVNYYVTTRCNLSCENCSAMIDCFEEPKDISAEIVIRDLKVFLRCVDECVAVEILGGEPFLYSGLQEVLDYLIKQEKVRNIILPTNCALIPQETVTTLLKNEKVFLRISDYGQLDKMGALIYFAEKEKIKLQVLAERQWDYLGGSHRRGKSLDQLRSSFMHCDISRYVKVIENGILHICERSARMHALGLFSSNHDYVALHEIEPPDFLQQKIKEIYYADYAEVCDYCDRGNIPKRRVTGGVQKKNPFPISEYTIIKRDEYARLTAFEKDKKFYHD